MFSKANTSSIADATGLTPTVYDLVEELRFLRDKGAFAAGSILPSESDISIELGVSRATLKSALSFLESQNELERDAQGRLWFKLPTSQFSPPRCEVFLWTSVHKAERSIDEFLRGLQYGTMQSSNHLFIGSPSGYSLENQVFEEEEFFKLALRSDHITSFVTLRRSNLANPDLYEQLLDKGVELYFVDLPAPTGIPGSYLGMANSSAAQTLTRHFLGLGHRRIAFLKDGPFCSKAIDRVLGYRQAMDDSGNRDLIRIYGPRNILTTVSKDHQDRLLSTRFIPQTEFSVKLAMQAVELVDEWEAAETRATALITITDGLAWHVGAECIVRGYSIPDDVSIGGFEHRRRFTRDGAVLCSIEHPYYELGMSLADRILVEGDDHERSELVLLPGKVFAGTTAIVAPPELAS